VQDHVLRFTIAEPHGDLDIVDGTRDVVDHAIEKAVQVEC